MGLCYGPIMDFMEGTQPGGVWKGPYPGGLSRGKMGPTKGGTTRSSGAEWGVIDALMDGHMACSTSTAATSVESIKSACTSVLFKGYQHHVATVSIRRDIFPYLLCLLHSTLEYTKAASHKWKRWRKGEKKKPTISPHYPTHCKLPEAGVTWWRQKRNWARIKMLLWWMELNWTFT